MKKIILIFIVIAAVTVLSCKKSVNTNNKKLTSITYDGNNTEKETYTYDNKGRLIKIEDTDVRQTYEFSGTTVIIKEFRKTENRFVATMTGTLDNTGKLINASGNFSYSINAPYTAQFSFEYNANGFLTKLIRTNNDNTVRISNITIQNDDITKIEVFTNNTLELTYTYEYYTDKLNKLNIQGWPYTILYYHNGVYGKMSKHLLKTATYPGFFYTMTYIFDNEGYPTKATSTFSSGPINQITYSYQ